MVNYRIGIEIGILDPSVPDVKENILLLQKFLSNLRKCGIDYSTMATEGYKYACILMGNYSKLTDRQAMDYASQILFLALTEDSIFGTERVNHQSELLDLKEEQDKELSANTVHVQ